MLLLLITTDNSDTTIFSSMLTTLCYQLTLMQFYEVDIIIPHLPYEDNKFLDFKQDVQYYNSLSYNLKPFVLILNSNPYATLLPTLLLIKYT